MLKSKTSLYLLLPLVVSIWGTVLYKVADVFEDEPEVLPAFSSREAEEIKKISAHSFSLMPVERDPFLGHSYKTAEKPVRPQRPQPQEVVWPEITYLGLVSDTGQASEIHVVQINGQQFLLERGESAEGVKLIHSGGGSISLAFQGNRKKISKNRQE